MSRNAVLLGESPGIQLYDDERIEHLLGLNAFCPKGHGLSRARHALRMMRNDYEAKVRELLGRIEFLEAKSEVLVRFAQED